jgi:hypothetical protein
MKNKIKLMLMAIIAGIAFTSCEKLDVDFDADYKTTLNINSQKSTAGSFSESATIDPLSNDDMAKYANKIKKIEVKEVIGVIKSINQPTVLETMQLSMTASGASPAVWTFSNVDLFTGASLSIDNSTGQFDNMQQILNKKEVFTVAAVGSTAGDNVQFSLEITIKTTVTANPL